jgi:hypothetical protein
LRLAKQNYRAKGNVDPVAVRGVVIDLGMDKKARLKIVSGKKINGKILSVDSDSFAILNTDTYRMERVLFSEVAENQEAKMPIWKKVIIGVGAGIGIPLLVWLVLILHSSD